MRLCLVAPEVVTPKGVAPGAVALRIGVLAAGVLLALGGCSAAPAAEASGGPAVPAVPPEAPAADAGGACILWDFPFLEEQLGVRFDVAAADQVADISTCVAQVVGAERPDLSLSVMEHTDADPAVFATYQVPAKAATVKGLGRAAYRLVSVAGQDHGPVIEVGWLSATKQVMTLRFTFAVGATPAEAQAMSARLISLARNLDGTA